MTETLLILTAGLILMAAWLFFRSRGPDPVDHAPPALRPLARAEETRRERARTEEVLAHLEEGVLLFSEVLTPVVANKAARRMLGVRGDALPGRLTSEGVLSVARRALVEGEAAEDTVSLWPERRRLRVRAVARAAEGGVIVVLRDITEELRTHQIRRQFVANASHELKSPVASLQALAEAIRQAVHDDPRAAERFSTRLVGEAERLGRLIADLLDLSRLEDPISTSNTAIDLSAVARSIIEEATPAARAKHITITAQVSSGLWVRGDGQQLGLLFRNLLDNAVRYTHGGGSVWVDVLRQGEEVVVRVADDGMGIPLHAQARVFERFYRVDKDRSRERGGTGLGLSIVKHVAELHGGDVSLQSELGEGSTFTTRLPALLTSNGKAAGTRAENKVEGR